MLVAVDGVMLLGMPVSREQVHRTLAEYQRQLAERPDDAKTLLKVGDLHLLADQPTEAVAVYARAAEVFTRNGEHLKAKAVAKQVLQVIAERAPGEAMRIADVLERAGLAAEAADLRSWSRTR